MRYTCWPIAAVALLGGAVTACTPPHYSVAAAQGPTHVTYAQRHHKSNVNDYLVDCKVDAAGRRSACQVIELVAPED